jgi:Transposase DNA-binding/Transposase Tn5 dimerisation domain
MGVGTLTMERRALPDRRLTRRLQLLIALLTARYGATLAQALCGWAPLKAAYRFFNNAAVTPAAILASARPDVTALVGATPFTLVVQDTTELNFSHHPGTRGLGPIGTGAQWGLLAHTALAIRPTEGTPLGVLVQHSWRRDPSAHGLRQTKRQRSTAAKESGRWLQVERDSLAALPADTPVLTVADREGDIFDWFAAVRPATAHLLVRAAQTGRLLAEGLPLLATVQQAPVLGGYRVDVPAAAGRRARTARCRVRVAAVALRQPRNRPQGTPKHAPVPVTAVLVEEVDPPAGEPPLHWLLLTTLAVPDFEAACTVVWYYTRRWVIERLHLVLKTGCRVEALQLQTLAALQRALAVYSLVAVQVMHLTYAAREQPEAPCTVALSTVEWQTLCGLLQPTAPPLATPPTLRQAARWVAQLGGFLGRTGDGEPGPLVIWRGLSRLHDAVRGWELAQPSLAVTPCG